MQENDFNNQTDEEEIPMEVNEENKPENEEESYEEKQDATGDSNNEVDKLQAELAEQKDKYVRKWLKSNNIWLQRSALLFQLKYMQRHAAARSVTRKA